MTAGRGLSRPTAKRDDGRDMKDAALNRRMMAQARALRRVRVELEKVGCQVVRRTADCFDVVDGKDGATIFTNIPLTEFESLVVRKPF